MKKYLRGHGEPGMLRFLHSVNHDPNSFSFLTLQRIVGFSSARFGGLLLNLAAETPFGICKDYITVRRWCFLNL